MQSMDTIGLVALFGAIIAGRVLSEKAMKQLNGDQKIRLMDSFSGFRKYSLIPLVVILVVYLLMVNANVLTGPSGHVIFLGGIVVYLLVSQVVAYRRLRRLDLPDSYLRTFRISQIVVLLGFVCWGALSLRNLL